MPNLKNTLKVLGLNRDNGLYFTRENTWQEKCLFTNRIKRVLEDKLKPTAFFYFDHKPLLLFYEDPQNINEIFKSIWNFNETPIVFIIQNGSLDIFNGFEYIKSKNSLKLLKKQNKLTDFTYFELVTGRTWEKYEVKFKYENRVDYYLLENIKAAREVIVNKVVSDSSAITTEDFQQIVQLANNLIGKTIFISYLIDREVRLTFKGIKKKWSRADFGRLLEDINATKKFFNFLRRKDQFNGDDLFPISEEDYELVSKYNLNHILIDLLEGVELRSGQQVLFDVYDFSIIPVEFISNVYESFIGEQEQAKQGAYYTPLFLVEYIMSQTLQEYFKENTTEFECKVLDPACGSGIFLVESLRLMINRYRELYNDSESDIPQFQSQIKKIAQDNIFGIDKDINAINVAIFSIYLTLLDYQDPGDIEDFKFPNIRESNFVESDFFSHEVDCLSSRDFRFIIGNPPWKGAGIGKHGNLYLKKRIKEEANLGKKYKISVNNGEIAEMFMLRVSDFSCHDTQIALIIRSNILYNLGYKTEFSEFRRYWLEEFEVNQVFELAPVRKEVFNKSNDPAVAPAAIVFYKYAYGSSTDNSIVEHITLEPSRLFNLFKIFALRRNSYKYVQQKRLKDYDWLWKVLVYGSYLDFNFIKRLKDNFSSIKEIISNKDDFIYGTGVQFSSNPTENSEHLKKYTFIDARAINPFHIDTDRTCDFNEDKVHRARDERLFKSPMLLVRKGLDTKYLKAKAAVSSKSYVFKDSLTSVKSLNSKAKTKLKKIAGLLHSELYSYFAINTFASIGIEREQAQNYNKFSIPYVDCEIDSLIVDIEKYQQNRYKAKKPRHTKVFELISSSHEDVFTNEYKGKLKKIDSVIFQALELSDCEKTLIDYSLNVARPVITHDKKKINNFSSSIPYKGKCIEQYANLFIERFKANLDDNEKKFITEIWYSKHIIGMFFKMVPSFKYKADIVWLNKSDDNIMATVACLGTDKITENIFVQKDIRGVEKDYFYIFKPNEKRLWHKAIGYLDVNEFMDAMLTSAAKGACCE